MFKYVSRRMLFSIALLAACLVGLAVGIALQKRFHFPFDDRTQLELRAEEFRALSAKKQRAALVLLDALILQDEYTPWMRLDMRQRKIDLANEAAELAEERKRLMAAP